MGVSGSTLTALIHTLPVVHRTVNVPGHTAMRVGTSSQNILGRTGDAIRINWGYAYVATPDDGHVTATATFADQARASFLSDSPLPPFDTRMPRACKDDWIVLAYNWKLGSAVRATPVVRRIVFAYDDLKAIRYFGHDFEPL